MADFLGVASKETYRKIELGITQIYHPLYKSINKLLGISPFEILEFEEGIGDYKTSQQTIAELTAELEEKAELLRKKDEQIAKLFETVRQNSEMYSTLKNIIDKYKNENARLKDLIKRNNLPDE